LSTVQVLFRLATNSLTGNWKPGGRESHPHQQEFLTSLILQGLKGGHMTPPLTFERSKKLRE